MVQHLSNLEPRLSSLVADELAPSERVDWYAQPRRGRFLMMSLPMVLFGIPWTGFALFMMWNFHCGSETMDIGGTLFMVPFVLIGLAMLSSPYWLLRTVARTVYVITDRRAILFDGGFRGTTIRSFGPEVLARLHRKQRRDGSGDLILEQQSYRDSDGDRRRTDIGFLGIENVKDVENLLKRIAQRDQLVS